MISFFRTGAFYKYFFLFILFIALRIGVFLFGIPLLAPQINWSLVAEKIHQGYFLYKEIWDDTSPLSALVYWLVHVSFGKSMLAHQVIATFLIFVQGIIFNQILQERRVFLELTMIPLLLYLVLMSSFLDFYIITPALLANTFLLVVVRYMFLHIAEKRKYNAVFEIGAYIGVATLFYFPSFVFLAVPLIAFTLFTSTKINDYLLMVFAFLFTIGIAFLIFYLGNSEYDFFVSFFQSHFFFNLTFYIRLEDLLLLFGIPFLLAFINFIRSFQYKRYTNYQDKCQNLMSLWLLVGFFTVFFDSSLSSYHVIPLILSLVFSLTHFFLLLSHTLIKEVLFLLLLANTTYFTFASLTKTPIVIQVPFTNWKPYTFAIKTDQMIVEEKSYHHILRGKKILVLGKSRQEYAFSTLATPYLNWQLAQRHFDNLDKYNIIISIFENFKKDMPDVIAGEKKQIEKIFTTIPMLSQYYQPIKGTLLYQKIK